MSLYEWFNNLFDTGIDKKYLEAFDYYCEVCKRSFKTKAAKINHNRILHKYYG